jgi:hypothetical protein
MGNACPGCEITARTRQQRGQDSKEKASRKRRQGKDNKSKTEKTKQKGQNSKSKLSREVRMYSQEDS